MPVSALSIIPGADGPARTTEAARLRRIRQRARASEAVVDLLASLAFGPDPEAGWPRVPHPAFAEARA